MPQLLPFIIFVEYMRNMDTVDKKYKVTVVVPLYRASMSELEQVSFNRLFEILGGHRIVVVKPRSLDLTSLLAGYKVDAIESFDDAYFAGIPGYNRLMMSEEFYSRFASSEYVLIYQLDAYVFRDELLEWCGRGYDYIGAPWPVRPIYKTPLYRLASWLKKKYCDATGRPNRQITRGKVGNGGFSLRKIDSHLRAVTQLHDVVRHFLTVKRHHTFNEDVLFSVEVNKNGLGFRYPDVSEAMQFAFDKYPSMCYKWNGRHLPFGCHSWYKRKMKRFWLPIILDGKMPE